MWQRRLGLAIMVAGALLLLVAGVDKAMAAYRQQRCFKIAALQRVAQALHTLQVVRVGGVLRRACVCHPQRVIIRPVGVLLRISEQVMK